MDSIIRYELLALKRTKKLLILPVVFALLSMLSAFTSKYMNQLLVGLMTDNGITIILPEPVLADSYITYTSDLFEVVLFIIMFLNIQEEDLPIDSGRWFYLAGGIVLLAPVAGLLLKIVESLPGDAEPLAEAGFGGVKQVGQVLFQQWLLPFEIVSILLLVALVGAVVLAGKRE